MTQGAEQHLEEAAHVQHAAYNPFDRRVTLTMAIVAALLACVTMLSHRAHNMTLQNQIKANDSITERANRFAWYQFKKDRQLAADGFARHLEVTVKNTRDPQAQREAQKAIEGWRGDSARWQNDLGDLKKQGDKLAAAIQTYNEEAHKYHHRADFFDYGELGIELSLILIHTLADTVRFGTAAKSCGISTSTRANRTFSPGVCIRSLALSIKSRGFWFASMAAAVLGCCVALCGFLIPPAREPHEREETAWLCKYPHGPGAVEAARRRRRA